MDSTPTTDPAIDAQALAILNGRLWPTPAPHCFPKADTRTASLGKRSHSTRAEKMGQEWPLGLFAKALYIAGMRFTMMLAVLFFVSGCGEPKYFVPGPDFQQSIHLSVEQTDIRVGQSLYLPVSRSSRGWVEVVASTVDTTAGDTCFWLEEPPFFEKDVSLNVGFIVEPGGNHRLSIYDDPY